MSACIAMGSSLRAALLCLLQAVSVSRPPSFIPACQRPSASRHRSARREHRHLGERKHASLLSGLTHDGGLHHELETLGLLDDVLLQAHSLGGYGLQLLSTLNNY